MGRTTKREALPIGLVVEGATEYRALPLILNRLGVRFTTPSVFQGQPIQASIRQFVAARLLKHVRVQLTRSVARVIVVLDRETRKESARDFGDKLTLELKKQVKRLEGEAGSDKIAVAVADRSFENWLLADPDGIERSNLFRRNAGLNGKVACHADERDAKSILQNAMPRNWYERPIHGPQLAAHIRVEAAKVRFCSKSFASFLRMVQQ